MLKTKRGDLTDSDHRHMRKVVGYVHRHLAQRPDDDVENSRWRYSLMNWGTTRCRTSARRPGLER